MNKKGVIEYSEPKAADHKMITKVNFDNLELKNYKPVFSLRV